MTRGVRESLELNMLASSMRASAWRPMFSLLASRRE
jgi:hypothetical protein